MSDVDADQADFDGPTRKRRKFQADVVMDNGHCTSDCHRDSPTAILLGSKHRYSKDDLIRIIIQAMVELGYPEAAQTLEQASKITVEPPEVKGLRKAVAAGDWSAAAANIKNLPLDENAKRRSIFLILKAKTWEVCNVAVLRPLGQ
jgi:hypothetical protein